MSARYFLDTNIFVSAWDKHDPGKQQRALNLMRLAADQRTGVISYQVIQEFLNVVLVKSTVKMSSEEAQQILTTIFRPLLAVHSSIPLFSDAVHLRDRYRLSWYDSLIVAAAQQSNCKILYTEDLQHGQQFGNLLVQNPFL